MRKSKPGRGGARSNCRQTIMEPPTIITPHVEDGRTQVGLACAIRCICRFPRGFLQGHADTAVSVATAGAGLLGTAQGLTCSLHWSRTRDHRAFPDDRCLAMHVVWPCEDVAAWAPKRGPARTGKARGNSMCANQPACGSLENFCGSRPFAAFPLCAILCIRNFGLSRTAPISPYILICD